MHLDLQLAIAGLGTAAALSLMASGLIVIFKGSGILNFAHGAQATAATYFYVWLFERGWPTGLAIVAGLALAVGLGVGMHLAVLRRLTHAPALAKVVATLGLMILVQGVITPLYGPRIPSPPRLLPTDPYTMPIGEPGFVLGKDRFWIFVIALVVTLLLAGFFRFSRLGLLTRALADNPQAVAVTGNSVSGIAVFNWALGSLLAGGAGILLSTVVPISPTFYTVALVTAIAASLVGGLRSFGGAFVAALAIGMAQPIIVRHGDTLHDWTRLSGWADALPFLVIGVVVIVRGRSIPVRDTVIERTLTRVTRVQRPMVGTAIALAAGATWYALVPREWADPLSMTLIGALVCLSLVVLVGFVGQVSLAQMAFAGFGAFATSVVAADWGAPFPLPLLLGGLAAVPLGMGVGLPALRLRGTQLAVVTLGAGLALDRLVFTDPTITGADTGRSVPAAELGDLSMNGVTQPRTFGVLVLVIVVAAGLVVALLRRSMLGQRMLAVRVNERGASASGISVTRTKLTAFAISSFLAGIAGALFGYHSLRVTYDSFGIFQSIMFVALAYIGGIGAISGAVIGGVLAPGGLAFHLADKIWDSEWLYALNGLLLLQVVAAHPDGLAGIPRQLRAIGRQRPHGRRGDSPRPLHSSTADTTEIHGEPERVSSPTP